VCVCVSKHVPQSSIWGQKYASQMFLSCGCFNYYYELQWESWGLKFASSFNCSTPMYIKAIYSMYIITTYNLKLTYTYTCVTVHITGNCGMFWHFCLHHHHMITNQFNFSHPMRQYNNDL
jgi:hypothetical protein